MKCEGRCEGGCGARLDEKQVHLARELHEIGTFSQLATANAFAPLFSFHSSHSGKSEIRSTGLSGTQGLFPNSDRLVTV